jgi:hypothetical protein
VVLEDFVLDAMAHEIQVKADRNSEDS